MTRKKAAPVEKEKTVLLIPLDDAKKKVNNQIEKGSSLFNAEIRGEEEISQIEAKYKT